MTPRDKAEFLWILIAFGVLLAVFAMAAVPFAVGLFAMNPVGEDLSDANGKDFWKVWFVGLVTIGASLLLIVLLVGFVRFSWYFWA